jgi:hypothetical protein
MTYDGTRRTCVLFGGLTSTGFSNETWEYGLVGARLPGDLNCDGAVDFDDINAFVVALSGPDGYAAAYPGCHWRNADCNGDDLVDFQDINAFVALLSG